MAFCRFKTELTVDIQLFVRIDVSCSDKTTPSLTHTNTFVLRPFYQGNYQVIISFITRTAKINVVYSKKWRKNLTIIAFHKSRTTKWFTLIQICFPRWLKWHGKNCDLLWRTPWQTNTHLPPASSIHALIARQPSESSQTQQLTTQ